MSAGSIDPRDRITVLVHYYRAMVGRADIWRTRMDATTNWAIGATAAMISFALGNAAVPHYVMHIASGMTVCFLYLEARRLTFYHLWQQRVLLLEKGLIEPAVAGQEPAEAPLSESLAPHLGRTVPVMPLGKAVARRLRRVYLYLFAVQLLAWVLKLANHPTPAQSLVDLAQRADAVVVPGPVFMGLTGLAFVAAILVAVLVGGRGPRRSPGEGPDPA